ncbi:putative quinol monooxygenase [Pararobbsia silviterrae]|uniref:Antibiotic biosynthesis monooxygenase n=1 Tax=Pararobbsia silviterrae TaxID=1792498 RepID=A0A494Y5T1_9BURK|nr:antibiotic biosynthesis monooxygenase family protein [Pararobbsia silviterrae]RKP55686.1 antibiotic biosynthesis monooxygenase [Pararobbsia silviterrae]
MSEVAVVAISTARPGKEAELETALRALIEPTRSDRGFITYDLHRNIQDPRTFVFIERWASLDDLQAHAKASHIRAFGARSGELCESSSLHILDANPVI